MNKKFLDYLIDTRSPEECVSSIAEWVTTGDKLRWLACLNPHSYVSAINDSDFSAALRDADWLIPDGTGIVLASKVFGGEIHRRVTGSDVFWGLHKMLNHTGGRVFFLGSTRETLMIIERKIVHDYPNIQFAGSYSPPFKPEFNEEDSRRMLEAVNSSEPDVLWVGMTAPKQEKWIYLNRDKLNVKFAGAVGAVFDFYSGNVKRSHPFFQRLGLEWLPRLVREPTRLWRRMFISTPLFVWHVVKKSLTAHKGI